MKYLIVTDPAPKPDIQFAYEHLRRQNMRPRFKPVLHKINKVIKKYYVVIRPVSDRDAVRYRTEGRIIDR